MDTDKSMRRKILTSDIQVEILPGLPANVPIHQFIYSQKRLYSEGLVIRVISEKHGEWIGNFQPGDPSTFFSGVYDYPKDSQICVIASGQAYIVNLNSPENYDIEKVPPITYVIDREGNLIYVTHCYVYSYDSMGLLWKTKQIALDGINIERIEKDFFIASAYSPTTSFLYKFKLDLRTGEISDSHELSNPHSD